MDPNITKALNDKLYDKRKSGALELEGLRGRRSHRERLARTQPDGLRLATRPGHGVSSRGRR